MSCMCAVEGRGRRDAKQLVIRNQFCCALCCDPDVRVCISDILGIAVKQLSSCAWPQVGLDSLSNVPPLHFLPVLRGRWAMPYCAKESCHPLKTGCLAGSHFLKQGGDLFVGLKCLSW